MATNISSNSNLYSKIDKSDWIFLVGYIIILLVIALVMDLLLNLISGSYIILPGVILGSVVFRNRLLAKNTK